MSEGAGNPGSRSSGNATPFSLGGRRTILAIMLRRNSDLAPGLRLYALLTAALGITMLLAGAFEEQTNVILRVAWRLVRAILGRVAETFA